MALALMLTVAVSSVDAFSGATLKKGSGSKADVMELQTLVGATPVDGVYGNGTEMKVKAWQATNGLKADGIFGPASMAKAKGMVAGPVQGACPTGYVTTTPVAPLFASCVLATPAQGSCPTGYVTVAPVAPTFATCAAASATVVIGTEGSVAFDYNSVPTNNISIKKGDTDASAVAFKIKASSGDMKITRLWVDVDSRLWLYANKATLVDGSTVLGTMDLSASTVTEVTSGSLWQLQFSGLNVVVPKDATKILTVKLTRPTLTQNSGVVTVKSTSSIRTLDGSGFSDTKTVGSDRAMNLTSSSALVGTLTSSLSANSPKDQSVAGVSTKAGVLTAVKLTDFDLKSKDGAINITKITATLTGGTIANQVASVELRDGTEVIDSVTGAASAVFSDLDVDIAKDTTKTLSIWAQMNPIGTPGAGYTTKGQGIKADVTISDAAFDATDELFGNVVPTGTVTGNTMYMYEYAPTLTLGAVSAKEAEGSAVGKVKGNYSLAFTVTAPAGSDIYVDGVATLAAVAKTAAKGGTMASSLAVSGVSSKGTGDQSTFDKITAGTSRTFTVSATIPDGTAAGFTGINLGSIIWNDVDNSAATKTTQTWGISDYKTAEVYVTA